MKKHKNKIISGVVIALLLALAFCYGGDAPGLRGWTPDSKGNIKTSNEEASIKTELTSVADEASETFAPTDYANGESEEVSQNVIGMPVKQTDETIAEDKKTQNTDNTSIIADKKEETAERIATENRVTEVKSGNKEYGENNQMVTDEKKVRDKYLTGPVPEGKPLPVDSSEAVVSDKQLTCILSVRCDTILDNIVWLDKEKTELVPKDGVIFAEKEVTFYEGESVFNLLLREMKRNKIHMEFENVPIYKSAYIEGIANLYEFDCGELSGWIYKVNDWFPNYGCSRYQLKEGDKVEWVYTCDLGVDVGRYGYSAKGK